MGGADMTKRKDVMREPNHKIEGEPMDNAGGLPYMPVVYPLPEDDDMLATRYIQRHYGADALMLIAMLFES
jgi:hypothetical protein